MRWRLAIAAGVGASGVLSFFLYALGAALAHRTEFPGWGAVIRMELLIVPCGAGPFGVIALVVLGTHEVRCRRWFHRWKSGCCPWCGYAGTVGPRCPECGRSAWEQGVWSGWRSALAAALVWLWAVGFGQAVAEMLIGADESRFRHEAAAFVGAGGQGRIARARAWPLGHCSLVYSPGQGIAATD